jgi:hypothetical protein
MFRVEWIQDALNELTEIWLQADAALRQAVSRAAHTMDQQLQADPYQFSESRSDYDRILFVYPLGAQIEIDAERGVVWVLNVWRFRRRGE